MLRIVVLSAFLATGAFGQLLLNGTCNLVEFDYVADLNVSKVVGVWNQVKRIANSQESGQCSTLNITAIYQNGQLTDVQFETSEVVNKTKSTRRGNILSTGLAGVNEFNFTDGTVLPFVVLSTNYTGHAIIYSCIPTNNATIKSVWAWQYHRQTSVGASEQAYVDSVIANNTDLKNATWVTTSHDSSTCNFGVVFGLSQSLLILTIMFVGKEFV